MAKLKNNFIGPAVYLEVVKKRKVLKRIKGSYHLCAWPVFDKNRVLSENEIFVRDKFRSVSKQASCVIQDPILKSVYASAAKPWQSAFNVAFKEVYFGKLQVSAA